MIVSRFLFGICANADVSSLCHHPPGIAVGSSIQLLGCLPGFCVTFGDKGNANNTGTGKPRLKGISENVTDGLTSGGVKAVQT